jgi:hypothetical protein
MSLAENYLPSRNPIVAAIYEEHRARRARMRSFTIVARRALASNTPRSEQPKEGCALVVEAATECSLHIEEQADQHVWAWAARRFETDFKTYFEDRFLIRTIQIVVANYYGIQVRDLISERRTDIVRIPRHVAFYITKTLTSHSLPTIGRYFGKRDHSTVINAIKRVKALLETDEKVRNDVACILGQLKGAL